MGARHNYNKLALLLRVYVPRKNYSISYDFWYLEVKKYYGLTRYLHYHEKVYCALGIAIRSLPHWL
jgi:hypothetical protein